MIDQNTYLAKYPICDTNIWVDLVFGSLCDCLFEKHKKIYVADVVEWEILRFNRLKESEAVAVQYKKYCAEGKIIVIKHNEIVEEDRLILERQLIDCNMRFSSGLADRPHEKNKGEIVSAIYAEYFELPFLKSDDNTFDPGREGRIAFPDLVVKDRRDTLEELVPDRTKRRQCLQQIKDARSLMDEAKRIHDTVPLDKEDTEAALAMLMAKWR